ncbi:MAG: hypothetical protein OEV60_05530 [Actinomycetota bacterium]|nr:hypothetical protein [Actinomycetota bacterium]MDH5225715.1 hypothetical protein [Actinomycetota bacterium]MDH5314235.1 hypothetical protein [Actinomycetota bacterium]
MSSTQRHIDTGLAAQAGLIGKAAMLWLLIVAVLGVGVVDAVSIARATLHLSSVATEAASDGAAAFQTQGRSVLKTCETVAASVEAQDPKLKLGKNACAVDSATGRVTVTLRTTANTLLAGRFGPTAEYTEVVVRETNGRSNV